MSFLSLSRSFVLSIFVLSILALPVGAAEGDTDDDGILDDDEIFYGFDPLNPDEMPANGTIDGLDDYDGDGLSTQDEIYVYGTYPTSFDTDEDGRSDGAEVTAGTDPLVAETADMTITDISFNIMGGNEILAYTAANVGSFPVDYTLESGSTQVYVDYVEADGTYGALYTYDWNIEMGAGSWTGALFAAGGSEELSTGVDLEPGDHTIMVCIDPAMNHGESEGGLANCLIETLSVRFPAPDLTISRVVFDDSDNSVDFMVRNVGEASVTTEGSPLLNFTFDFLNADFSTSSSEVYTVDDFGTDYRAPLGVSTVTTGPDAGEFVSCTLYVLATVDSSFLVRESNEDNNANSTVLDLCPGDGEVVNGFVVEAGPDQGVGFGSAFVLNQAYAETTSTLSTTSIDWGDGSPVEVATETVNGDRIYLGGTHYYTYLETFTVTVCADDGSESLCDSFKLSVTGTSSGDSSTRSGGGSSGGSDDSVDLAEDTEELIEEVVEEDPLVDLSSDDEVANCDAMTFEDVSEEDSFYTAICEMWAADVLHGKTDTFFGAEDDILRDEASKIFTRLFGYVEEAYEDTPAVEESSFVDVDAEDPLAYYVEVAVEEKIMDAETDSFVFESEADGYVEVISESSFRPKDSMTALEIADSLEMLLGDNEAGETLDAEGYEVEDTMSRGTFVEFLYSLLD